MAIYAHSDGLVEISTHFIISYGDCDDQDIIPVATISERMPGQKVCSTNELHARAKSLTAESIRSNISGLKETTRGDTQWLMKLKQDLSGRTTS
jgi:hypothetical protein